MNAVAVWSDGFADFLLATAALLVVVGLAVAWILKG